MALLMLKTHDLSWQDHTLNVEVMLAPSKSQLLSNKHKALASKCDTVKRNYDKEKDAVLKNIMIEKRMMERKRQEIFKRRSDILFRKVSKEPSVPPSTGGASKRIHSAPSTLPPTSAGSSDRSSSSNVFLTELRNQSVSTQLPSDVDDHQSGRISAYSDANTFASTNVSTRGSFLRSPYFSAPSPTATSGRFDFPGYDSKRSSKVPSKSVRFQDKFPRNQAQIDEGQPLNDKIKQFIKVQEEFNHRPVSVSYMKRPTSEPVGRTEPLVAKRHRNLRLDTLEIEKAFDNFCERKSVEEFQKLVKLTSKLRASVRLARNTSFTPSLAAFKAARLFKANLTKSAK